MEGFQREGIGSVFKTGWVVYNGENNEVFMVGRLESRWTTVSDIECVKHIKEEIEQTVGIVSREGCCIYTYCGNSDKKIRGWIPLGLPQIVRRKRNGTLGPAHKV